MQIKHITWHHRNDYRAIMVCEHCGHEQEDRYGYDDAYYHQNVIPAMECKGCGMDGNGVNVRAQREAAEAADFLGARA